MDRLARSVIDLNGIVQQITGAPTEQHLLGHGYVASSRDGFDRERAIFLTPDEPRSPKQRYRITDAGQERLRGGS